MATSLAPYTLIGIVAETEQGILHRGVRRSDNAPVWIKTPRSDAPTPRELAAVQREYAILQQLDAPGVIPALGLLREGDRLGLVLENSGGLPLRSLLAAQPGLPLAMPLALWIAAESARILAAVHDRGVIHQRLSPDSILVDLENRRVGLLDFAAAAQLALDARLKVLQLDAPAAALPYLAPEQTGRVDRLIDRRTDLYGLGITLYEMLTGSVPFPLHDPNELVHSILARMPVPPHTLRPEIPAAVSALLLKLLAKSAEDRYQRARGVEADLQTCLGALAQGAELAIFPLDQHERGALRIPQKLYGRAGQLAALAEAGQRIGRGGTELILVQGGVGTGKTALLRTFQETLAGSGGICSASRFEPRDREAPYIGLARALRGILAQRLAEGPKAQARLRTVLLGALGENVQLLVDILPELAEVLGPRPRPPELGRREAQNRLKLAMQSFLRVFSTAEHPIILLLDDAQWADPASIELLKLFLTDAAPGQLLVLAAFAENEDAAAAARALAGVEQAGIGVSRLTLEALTFADIQQLLAEALGCAPERAGPLAEILLSDTAGQPLALHQRLEALRDEGLFLFDAKSQTFAWDLTRIEQAVGAVDVSALLNAKLRRLPAPGQRVLALAACIGNQFSLDTLSALYQRTMTETARALGESLSAGLVLTLGESESPFVAVDASADPADDHVLYEVGVHYLFADARVQQAAAALLPAAEKTKLHRRISQLLWEGRQSRLSDQELFEVVRHDLLAAPLIAEVEARQAIALRLLQAGRRARLRTAYQTAASYYAAGAGLDAAQWETAPQLGFPLLIERAECEHLAGQYAQAEALFLRAEVRAPSHLQRVEVAALRVVLYTMEGNLTAALSVGRSGLQLLDMDLPLTKEAMEREVSAGHREIADRLAGRDIATLIDAPQMIDPLRQAALRLLLNLQVAALLTDPLLRAVVVLLHVRLSLRHGHCELSAYGYMAYGTILARAMQRYSEAHAWGLLALRLNDRYKNIELTCKLHHLFGAFLHFLRPLREALTHFDRAVQAGLQSGDFHYAAFAACQSVAGRICMGDEVRGCLEQTEQMHELLQRAGDRLGQSFMLVARQALKALSGATANPLSLSDAAVDEAALAAKTEQPGFAIVATFYRVLRLQLLYLHGQYEAALQEVYKLERIGASSEGMYFFTEASFFACLTLTALPVNPANSALMETHHARVQAWARACPENYRHKEQLIAAERARLAGDDLLAMQLYDESIASALVGDYVRDESLAKELSGLFHRRRGRQLIARAYLGEAYLGYLRWGATAKAEVLAAHAGLSPLMHSPGREVRPSGTMRPPAPPRPESAGDALDVAAIVRATQTIVEEIVLAQVLSRSLQIIVECAGAQRGVLILEQDGRLQIQASLTAASDAASAAASVPNLSTLACGPVEEYAELPQTIIAQVASTKAQVVLGDAVRAARYLTDPYIATSQPCSVLCLPLLDQGRLAGIMYLENRVTRDAFSAGRIDLLQALCSLVAIAVKNARLYERVQAMSHELQRINAGLEQSVLRRTDELSAANSQLAAALAERARSELAQAALREAIIAAQRERLAELAAPLIPIAQEIMIMPLIGRMDSERAGQVLDTAVHGAHAHRTRFMILDITGMTEPDTGAAMVLLRATRALGLLGTRVVITGVRPDIAQTLVEQDTSSLVTHQTLEGGITYARAQLSKPRPAPSR